MSLILQSSGGGQVTIQEPTTASNFTQTLPAATGTVMVSSNQPAFSVSLSGTQNITTSTWTKVNLNVEEFDTASCFDSTTNYRFTPNVAGYYQINGSLYFTGTSTVRAIVAKYKNGIANTAIIITIIKYSAPPKIFNEMLMFVIFVVLKLLIK
jgi:hypothetical protein